MGDGMARRKGVVSLVLTDTSQSRSVLTTTLLSVWLCDIAPHLEYEEEPVWSLVAVPCSCSCGTRPQRGWPCHRIRGPPPIISRHTSDSIVSRTDTPRQPTHALTTLVRMAMRRMKAHLEFKVEGRRRGV